MRIARVSNRRIQVKPPDDVTGYELSLSLDDGEQREHLGQFCEYAGSLICWGNGKVADSGPEKAKIDHFC